MLCFGSTIGKVINDLAIGPQLPFQQVYFGVNRPPTPILDSTQMIFQDEVSIRNSWVSAALTKDNLNKLIAKVDFRTQFIYSIGTFPPYKGIPSSMYLDRIYYKVLPKDSSGWEERRIFLGPTPHTIGFADPSCIGSKKETSPFIIVIVDYPEGELGTKVFSPGFDQTTYRMGCARSNHKR